MYQVALFCLDLSLDIKKRPHTDSFIIEGDEIRQIQSSLKEQSKCQGLEDHTRCLNACERIESLHLSVARTAGKNLRCFWERRSPALNACLLRTLAGILEFFRRLPRLFMETNLLLQ